MGLELNSLRPAKGANRKRKRVGREPGSGHGKTACRGHKGQLSRSGSSMRAGFEGGQMPLYRRLPKRGFTNIFKKEFAEVNVDQLKDIPAGSLVDSDFLLEKRIIRKLQDGIKILGRGEIKNALTIRAHKFSKSAATKIEKAGGTAEVIS